MGLSQPRNIFGIHSAAFYNPVTLEPYGIAKVLGSGQLNLQGEQVELRGGSSKFPWSIQDGNISADISLTIKEYPDFIMELFLGKRPTYTASDTTGTVSAAANKKGTSIINGSNGISGVAATSSDEADLKFGKYILKATGSDSVQIYCISSDVDFNRGTDVEFVDDTMAVGSPITITATTIPVAALGITITGVGTPAFTTGDTAYFEVLPIHAGESHATFGGLNDVFPTFGVILTTQQLGSGEMYEFDCPNCKGSGLVLGGAEKAFTETPLTAKLSYDAGIGGLFKYRYVKPA